MERRAPSRDSALGLVPGSLLSGDHAGFYDGFKGAGGGMWKPTRRAEAIERAPDTDSPDAALAAEIAE